MFHKNNFSCDVAFFFTGTDLIIIFKVNKIVVHEYKTIEVSFFKIKKNGHLMTVIL